MGSKEVYVPRLQWKTKEILQEMYLNQKQFKGKILQHIPSKVFTDLGFYVQNLKFA